MGATVCGAMMARFVRVDGSGRIRWVKEFPSMYASSSDLLARLKPYLG